MATYEQELAEWEAERREVWETAFDEREEEENNMGCATYADHEVEAWERRYPRPERKLVQKPEKVEPPSRIGCQDLTYTREGVRLSSGMSVSLTQLQSIRHFSSCGKEGDPILNAFGPVAGYRGVYHDGYIIIGGQRVTTAQLAAMIERCEELATKLPEKRYLIDWYGEVSKDRAPQEYGVAYGEVFYPEGGLKDKILAERFCEAANKKWAGFPAIIHEIREVEVYE